MTRKGGVPVTTVDLLQLCQAATVQVGDGGRGFVIEADRRRLVLTAAHCLPPTTRRWHSICPSLLGPLGREERTVWAECLFFDPVADVAVLGEPEYQEHADEAEAYDDLIDEVMPLRIDAVGAPKQVYMLGLDLTKLITGKAKVAKSSLWVTDLADFVVCGMSGSPIVAPNGRVLGVVAVSGGTDSLKDQLCGPNPLLPECLPAWLAKTFFEPCRRDVAALPEDRSPLAAADQATKPVGCEIPQPSQPSGLLSKP